MSATHPLKELFVRLKACPTWNNRFEADAPWKAWDRLRVQAWEPEGDLAPAMMAALVLSDDSFAVLLTHEERAQLSVLAARALDRYRHETHPPDQPGNTIAATLEEIH